VVTVHSRDGQAYRPEILVEFEVDSIRRRAWLPVVIPAGKDAMIPDARLAQRSLKPFRPGQHLLVYYNPVNPTEIVLPQPIPWWTAVVMFVPISLCVLGASGLTVAILHGKKGRRAAPLLLRFERPRDETADGEIELWPSIPRPLSPQDSPGIRLPIRLPAQTPFLANFLGWGLATVLWNGLALTLLAWAVGLASVGRGDWTLVAFTLVPVGIGGAGTGYLLRNLLRQWSVGPTILEISDQPLRAGERYQVYLSQFGTLKVNRLSVSLVCEERALFREGTEIRLEIRRVQKLPLFRREAFEVTAGVPFEAFFDLEVPPRVMHSFRSPNNEIAWGLLVEQLAQGLPPVIRLFPVVIYPPKTGRALA
jgi:hypothetical protein